jgi:uncharacterized protein (DUF924 family)
MTQTPAETPQSILDFWFGDYSPKAFEEHAKLWFGGGPKVDEMIAARFWATVETLAAGDARTWASQGAKSRLAAIIALDQFSRSIYRNTPQSFANDPLALSLTKEAIAHGEEAQLGPVELFFLYLPLEHSEAAADQDTSLRKFAALEASALSEVRDLITSAHDYAIRHAQVIARFHRFPHRNKILGRESTAEELEFLKKNPGF